DRLPAYSVAPNAARLRNGVIALSTGRPGLFLWFATDPRATTWHSIDVVAFHNAVLDSTHHIRPGSDGFKPSDVSQTTAYAALLEVAPNRLCVVYDRVPYGWLPVPTAADMARRVATYYPFHQLRAEEVTQSERERIYLLELEVERA